MMSPDGNDTSGPGLDNATLQMLQSPALATALPVLYSLVAAVSIPGNLLSLWVLCRDIGPRSPSAIFMMQLSAADLLLAAVLPFQIHYHGGRHHWAFGSPLCAFVTVAFYANLYGSELTVTCLSVERFLAIVHPLASASWRRRRYAAAACAAVWLLVAAALWPLARADLTFPVAALGVVTCFDVLPWAMLPGPAAWAAFLLTLLVVLFLVPVMVTVGCYAAAIRALRRAPRDGPGGGRRRRAIGLAAVVLLAFVTCFVPNNVALLAHVVGRLFFGRSFYRAYKLALGLGCLNVCLDPFVYYFASREFQLRLRHYLRLCCPRRRRRRRTHTPGRELASPRTVSARSGDGVEPAAGPCLDGQDSAF